MSKLAEVNNEILIDKGIDEGHYARKEAVIDPDLPADAYFFQVFAALEDGIVEYLARDKAQEVFVSLLKFQEFLAHDINNVVDVRQADLMEISIADDVKIPESPEKLIEDGFVLISLGIFRLRKENNDEEALQQLTQVIDLLNQDKYCLLRAMDIQQRDFRILANV